MHYFIFFTLLKYEYQLPKNSAVSLKSEITVKIDLKSHQVKAVKKIILFPITKTKEKKKVYTRILESLKKRFSQKILKIKKSISG